MLTQDNSGDLAALVQKIKCLELDVKAPALRAGPGMFRGVSTEELSPNTMESSIQPESFCGEVVDTDGICRL